MRHPVTDIALLSYIARKKADSIRYTEAAKACRSTSSASRALRQLIREGLIEPRPKLLGLRYVTEYAVTPRGKEVAGLALQLSELREGAGIVRGSPRGVAPKQQQLGASNDSGLQAEESEEETSQQTKPGRSNIKRPGRSKIGLAKRKMDQLPPQQDSGSS